MPGDLSQDAVLAATNPSACVDRTATQLDAWGCPGCGSVVLKPYQIAKRAEVYNVGRSAFYVQTVYSKSPTNAYHSPPVAYDSQEQDFTIQFRGTVYTGTDDGAFIAALMLNGAPTSGGYVNWLGIAYVASGNKMSCVVTQSGATGMVMSDLGTNLLYSANSATRNTFTCVLAGNKLRAYLNGDKINDIDHGLMFSALPKDATVWLGQPNIGNFASILQVNSYYVVEDDLSSGEVSDLHTSAVAQEATNPPAPPACALYV